MNRYKKLGGVISAAVLALALLLPKPAQAAKAFEMGVSTPTATPVQVCTGSACALYDIALSSNVYAVNDTVSCFSSNTTAGYTTADQEGTAAAPRLDSVTIITANTPQARKANARPEPVAASNGIVCIARWLTATRKAQIFYSDGN